MTSMTSTLPFMTSVQFSSEIITRIRTATNEDYELQVLKEVVFRGWPQSRTDVHKSLLSSWNFRDEISIAASILLKGSMIIIPESIQRSILSKLHAAHEGMEKTKLRASEAVCWPGLYRDIEEVTHTYGICQEFQATQTKEPLIPSQVPPQPWHTVGTDLFQ